MSYAYTGQLTPPRTSPPGYGPAQGGYQQSPPQGAGSPYSPYGAAGGYSPGGAREPQVSFASPPPQLGSPHGASQYTPSHGYAPTGGGGMGSSMSPTRGQIHSPPAVRGLLTAPAVGAVSDGIRAGCKVRLAAGRRTNGVLGMHEVGLVIRVDGPAHIAPYKVRSPTGGEGWFAASDLVLVAHAEDALAERALSPGFTPGGRMGGTAQKLQTLVYTLHVEPGETIGMSCKSHNGCVVVSSIAPSSPAHLAGMTPGCVVSAVNGIPVSRLSDVKEAVDYLRTNQAHPIGLQVEVDRVNSSHTHPTLEPTYEQLAAERLPTLRSLHNPMSSRYTRAAAQQAASRGSPPRDSQYPRQMYYSPPKLTVDAPPVGAAAGSPAGSSRAAGSPRSARDDNSNVGSHLSPRAASRTPSRVSDAAGSTSPKPTDGGASGAGDAASPPKSDAGGDDRTPSPTPSDKPDINPDPSVPDIQRVNADGHNKYRRDHGADGLEYQASLAEHARAQADICLGTNRMEHGNTPDGEGQNIYFKGVAGKDLPPDEELVALALAAWYAEKKDYVEAGGGTAGFNANAGHFTQMVWKATTHVGVAIAKNATTAYVVCNYAPGGNLFSDEAFKENVQA